MFGSITNFDRGGYILKHSIIYISVRAFMLCLCIGLLLFLLVLTPYPAAAVGEESLLSAGMAAKGETEAQKYSLIQPDLHLLHRYVPRKPRLVGRDESARNEISVLIAGMPRAVREEYQYGGKESAQIMRLLASSTNENEADTNNTQKPIHPLSAVSATVAAHQPSSHDRWPYFLPFLGVGAEKRGYKLPYSFGVTPGFYSGKRHIKVTDANVYIAGRTIPAAGLTKIKVRSRELNWSVRLDTWVFPFLSLYALCGYTRQHTDASIGVNLIDNILSRRGGSSRYFKIPVDLTGITYGGGITLVGGYKKFFTAFDSNYTVSALHGDLILGNKFSPDVKALLCSTRLGWREKIGRYSLNFWIGETYWDTTNRIASNLEIPVVGKVGFSLMESTKRPWSTHIGTHVEISQTFQFMVDMGTNFRGLFCIAPAFICRF
jgi:hypothetical protein